LGLISTLSEVLQVDETKIIQALQIELDEYGFEMIKPL
jgi:hypothetical protein